jgi:1,4-dihydroxy-2-naphthoyl-CoA hydrolase
MTNEEITPELSAQRLAGFFPGNLGIELTHIDDDRVEGRMPVTRDHLHPGGYLHGGAWTAFADTVAAWGTFRHLAEGSNFTTAELKMNVFAAAREGDELHATGRPLHVGRRSQAWEVRIHVAGRDKLAALFVCTQMVI